MTIALAVPPRISLRQIARETNATRWSRRHGAQASTTAHPVADQAGLQTQSTSIAATMSTPKCNPEAKRVTSHWRIRLIPPARRLLAITFYDEEITTEGRHEGPRAQGPACG